MLLVFFGSDRSSVRNAATSYIDNNLPEDGTLTTFDARDYQPGQLSDSLGAASLFGGEEWFVFDTPSDNLEFQNEVQENLSELSESKNIFVLLEGTLLAPAKKKYAKYTDKIEEFAAEKSERFNTFALADALARRDKRKLWLLSQEAKLKGIREEEVIGILWWQLKALRLAASTSSAEEAGMKSFPYSKAKQSLKLFTDQDLLSLSQSLLELYHAGHAGLTDLDLALEGWILKN